MQESRPALAAGPDAPQAVRAKRLIALWAPVVLCMAAIFYVSAQNTWTTVNLPPILRAGRKLGHVVEYAALGLLLARALLGVWSTAGAYIGRALLQRVWVVSALLATAYAVTDELHQAFVPGRQGSVYDVLLDALSAVAAIGIWYIISTRHRQGIEGSS